MSVRSGGDHDDVRDTIGRGGERSERRNVSNYVAQAPSAGAKDTDKDASKAAEAIEARSDGPEMLKSSFDQLPAGTHCIGEHAELFKSPFNPLPPTAAVGAVVSPARVNVWNMFIV